MTFPVLCRSKDPFAEKTVALRLLGSVVYGLRSFHNAVRPGSDLFGGRQEEVLYFTKYIVIDSGNTELVKKQLLTEKEYADMREKYEDDFVAEMGAEAVKELLDEYNPDRYASSFLRLIYRTSSVYLVLEITSPTAKLSFSALSDIT